MCDSDAHTGIFTDGLSFMCDSDMHIVDPHWCSELHAVLRFYMSDWYRDPRRCSELHAVLRFSKSDLCKNPGAPMRTLMCNESLFFTNPTQSNPATQPNPTQKKTGTHLHVREPAGVGASVACLQYAPDVLGLIQGHLQQVSFHHQLLQLGSLGFCNIQEWSLAGAWDQWRFTLVFARWSICSSKTFRTNKKYR